MKASFHKSLNTLLSAGRPTRLCIARVHRDPWSCRRKLVRASRANDCFSSFALVARTTPQTGSMCVVTTEACLFGRGITSEWSPLLAISAVNTGSCLGAKVVIFRAAFKCLHDALE